MTLKGKIYSLAKQREDIDSRNVFESMIKRSADQNSIFMDGRNLAAGSIFADQISAGAITTGKIKADAVTTDKIIAGAITTTHLAANSVTAQKISVDELSAITSDIGTITAGLIKSKDDSSYFNMTQGKFSFANDKILYDGKDLRISADSIDLEGKVTFSSFSNSLQTTWSDSVRDSSDAKTKTDEWSWDNTTEIDGGSIRARTITTDKIKANSITSEEIKAGSITSEEINVNELSSIATNIGTVNAGLIKSFDESIIINLNEGLITLGKPLKIQGKTVATEDDISSLGYGDIISKSGQKIFTDQAEDSAVHVEVDGKSYQHGDPSPDYPIEIHSLNDFDVVSSVGGRNLLKNSDFSSGLEGWSPYQESSLYMNNEGNLIVDYSTVAVTRYNGLKGNAAKLELGEIYTVTAKVRRSNPDLGLGIQLSDRWRDVVDVPPVNEWGIIKYTNSEITNENNTLLLIYSNKSTQEGILEIEWIKIEKGNKETPYSPAPEDITKDSNHPLIDKINLNLSEPLRSVGDVKDRLFKDSGGMWKVERNVGETILDGTEAWVKHPHTDDVKDVFEFTSTHKIKPLDNSSYYLNTSSSHLKSSKEPIPPINHMRVEQAGGATHSTITLPKSLVNESVENLKDWLMDNNITIQYEKALIIETLDQELQDKLNTLKSFKGSNYIYTVNNTEDLPDQIKENLIPTLHATFKGSGWLPKYNAEQARIDLKSETNNIRNDMDNLVASSQYNFDKGETDQILSDYQAAIDAARRELNGLVNEDGELILGEDGKPLQKGVVNEVLDLLGRTALVERDYGEHSEKLKFMDTEFVRGAEGMFIGDTKTRTGIMISPRVEETTEHEARASRIDFLDNDKVVAYISSYMMEISRGIFVESAQIGEHKIETIGDGHTTFQWIPK